MAHQESVAIVMYADHGIRISPANEDIKLNMKNPI